MRVAMGADHGGYELKEILKAFVVSELGFEVEDYGCHGKDAVDYPDFAFLVAQAVAEGRCTFGVMIDGAGIGSCMVANKVPGVRAAMGYDWYSVNNSREHNDANVLTLGGQVLGAGHAKVLVKHWLCTPFGGGRHQRRVDKIMDVERGRVRC